ncbi:MAG: DUF917 domain-containing protein [Gammaproteobacteria bacterium]|nr:DUF917 domain-containing protein [Gammaproteobacteria bacterium]MCY4338299.1 DUF917 domain-containing protein [Gammaproteobacteria bacterium]
MPDQQHTGANPVRISPEDMKDLARGAAFLGTGGGGDPYIGRLMAENAIRDFGMPEIINVDDLDDTACVFIAAMVGAPTVMVEKCASGDDIDLAVKRLGEIIGKQPDAITSAEIGGVNSTLPIVAAARLGLPLLDCDGMGRAFPEIQMVTFNIYGVSPTPAVIVNEHLETVIVETEDPKRAENIIRAAAIQMGLSVMFSAYSMTGRQIKETSVRGTLSIALDIGRTIRSGRENGEPVEALLRYLRATDYYQRCKVLMDGKIIDVSRKTDKGWSVGHCVVGSLADPASCLTITFKNEYLVARQNGRTVAIVPDLICMVDSETAEPITVETLRYGQRVKVLGMSAAPLLRTPAALAVVGPEEFGIEEQFQPIEAIHDDI